MLRALVKYDLEANGLYGKKENLMVTEVSNEAQPYAFDRKTSNLYYCCPLNFKTTRFAYPQRPSIGVADSFFEK